MAFATYEDTTATVNNSYSTSHSFNYPATVNAGDIIVMQVSFGTRFNVSASGDVLAGWDSTYFAGIHDYHSWQVWTRLCDGTEGGGSESFTTGTAVKSTGQMIRFSDAYQSVAPGSNTGIVGVAVAVSADAGLGFGTSLDPPSLEAPWGSDDNHWLEMFTAGSTGATVSSYSTGYSNGAATSTATGFIVGSATRTNAASSEDPDAITIDDPENHKRIVMVIRPSGGALAATPTSTGQWTAGGATTVTFTDNLGGQVPHDLKILVDWDGDGDFSEPVEDVTSDTLSLELMKGRDYPSQLTGKTVPGQLKATLKNVDGKYSAFNADSPLNTHPFDIQLGRLVRVQTSGTTAPDPVLRLRDRFGTAGMPEETETGQQWSAVGAGAGWTVASNGTVSADGDGSLVADLTVTEGYAQLRIAHCDSTNTVGLIYRYLNDDNYGRVTISDGTVTHTDVTSGSPANHGTDTIEMRRHMSLGVLVNADDDVTVYLDGVALFTDAGDAHDGDGSSVGSGWGIYVDYSEHRYPAFDEIYVFDGLWSTATGMVFTSDLTDLIPSISPSQQKRAHLTAEGWLTRLAGPEVTPPYSIGVTAESTAGVTTGLMVGQTLASADLLHPPPPGGLDTGQITLGGVGTGNAKALHIARLFEATEFGFLYELPEGPIDFEDRAARAGKAVKASLSDAAGAQVGIETIDVRAWRREVFNRVETEVSPVAPVLENVLTTTADQAAGETLTITFTLPTSMQATAGDLCLVKIIAAGLVGGETLTPPPGWETLRSPEGLTHEHWFAAKLTAGDLGDSVTFYTASTTGGGAWIARQFVISSWLGSIDGGVALAETTGERSTTAQAGTNSPPALLVPWGRQPTLFVATRSGMYSSTGTASGTDPDDAPNGYHDLDSDVVSATVSPRDVVSQYAWKHDVTSVEQPSAFTGTFSGFDNLETSTVAIRGYCGDPPEQSTGEIIVTDDLTSQADYNVVSTYPETVQFFADSSTATTFAGLITGRHGVQRPILLIGFTATKTKLHRYLAYTLRINDLVRVVLTETSDLGVNSLYHVESIRHSVGPGGEYDWFVEIELSPTD